MLNAETVSDLMNGRAAGAVLKAWKNCGQVEELLAAAREASVNPGSRWFAIHYLASFPRDDVIAALTELLSDPDFRLRQQAARSLKEIGPRARPAVPALTRALFDGDGAVRVAAARALGTIGDTAAIPELTRAADTTGWDALHAWATDSLVKLGAPQASEHLVRRLVAEKSLAAAVGRTRTRKTRKYERDRADSPSTLSRPSPSTHLHAGHPGDSAPHRRTVASPARVFVNVP